MGKYAPIVPGVGLLDALKDGWQEMPIRHLCYTPCVATGGTELLLSEYGLIFDRKTGVSPWASTWDRAAQLAAEGLALKDVTVTYAKRPKPGRFSPEELKIPLSYVTGTRLSASELPGRVVTRCAEKSATGPVTRAKVLPVEFATAATVSYLSSEQYPVVQASKAYLASDDELADLAEAIRTVEETGSWLHDWYKAYPTVHRVALDWWQAEEAKLTGSFEPIPIGDVLKKAVRLPSPWISDARLCFKGRSGLYEVHFLSLWSDSEHKCWSPMTWDELIVEFEKGSKLESFWLKPVSVGSLTLTSDLASNLEELFVDGRYAQIPSPEAGHLGDVVRVETMPYGDMSYHTYVRFGPLALMGRTRGRYLGGGWIGFACTTALRMLSGADMAKIDRVVREYQLSVDKMRAWWKDRMTVADYLKG